MQVNMNLYWLKINIAFCHCFTESLTIKYARSSGPGGQNVNKGNTLLTQEQVVKEWKFIKTQSKDVQEVLIICT